MKRNFTVIILIIAVIVVAGLIWNESSSKKAKGNEDNPTPIGGPAIGSAAPSIELKSPDGSINYKVGGKRDKLLVLNFWASWCGPCDKEAPDLVKLYGEYENRVDFYGVNATKYDTLHGALEFIKEKELPFPILMDMENMAGTRYDVRSYPITFIVDRNGIVQERLNGIYDIKEWRKKLDRLL